MKQAIRKLDAVAMALATTADEQRAEMGKALCAQDQHTYGSDEYKRLANVARMAAKCHDRAVHGLITVHALQNMLRGPGIGNHDDGSVEEALRKILE